MVQELDFQPAVIVPPNNLLIEESILGGILLDPTAIARVSEIIQPESFYSKSHQIIYQSALALTEAGKPCDLMSVSTHLLERGLLDQAGGQVKLSTLLDLTVSAVNIDHYAETLKELQVRRQMISLGQQITQMGHHTAKDVSTLFQEIEQKISDLSGTRTSTEVQTISEVLDDAFAKIEERSLLKQPPGFLTGFYDLDAKTQGFQRSDFVVIAGRPSMGKTAAALDMARQVADLNQVPVLIFSMEMSKPQIVERLLSSMSKVELFKIRSGKLSPQDWEPLGHAFAKLSELPMHIDDSPYLGVSDIRAKAKRIIAERGDLGMIVIDYIQLMQGTGGENRVQELSRLTRQLKQLARELKVTIVGLSQLSRGVESRSDKRPMLSDLRESGSIEQDTDLVMMLYRDEYYNPDSADRGIAEIIITKHRNGPTGTVKLLFDQKYTRFLNTAHV